MSAVLFRLQRHAAGRSSRGPASLVRSLQTAPFTTTSKNNRMDDDPSSWTNQGRTVRVRSRPQRQTRAALSTLIPKSLPDSEWFSSSSSSAASTSIVRFKSTSVVVNNPTTDTITDGNDNNNDGPDKPTLLVSQPQELPTKKIQTTTTATTTTNQGESYLWDLGLPSLLPEWKKMFQTKTLFTDVSAGLTVGCVAVPLSLAIAVASGVPAEVGLVTAAVSGVAGGLLGGTTLAITGPAAAISLLVVGAVEQHGLDALPFITLACGGMQLMSGVTRLGVAAKLVPISVIAGFTTGVGTLILTGQIPKALGMSAPAGMNPLEVVAFVGENITTTLNPSAAALAIGTAVAMFALPKVHPKMPAALLAVGGATLATHAFGLDVQLIGQLPSGLEAFQFGIPIVPPMEAMPSLLATTFLIYAMTSAESLLSCAALEKMKKTEYKHNPDQELVGQGLANMGAAMFMGMPVTSVIARSGLNVRLNAETRLPSLVQAGFVFSSVVFFSDKIATIPMPALSGMLITTGLGMLNPTEFKHCYAVQPLDTIPFLTTIGGMVSFGLAEGIGIGCASALALNYNNWAANQAKMTVQQVKIPLHHIHPKFSRGTSTGTGGGLGGGGSAMTHHQANTEKRTGTHDHDRTLHTDTASTPLDDVVNVHDNDEHLHFSHPSHTVWQLEGPINFISMFEIDDLMRKIKEERASDQDDSLPIILDMKLVTSLEFTGVEELVNRLIEVADGAPIQMFNCDESTLNALDQCDPKKHITRFSVVPSSS